VPAWFVPFLLLFFPSFFHFRETEFPLIHLSISSISQLPHIPHPTSHIPHPTSHIPHTTSPSPDCFTSSFPPLRPWQALWEIPCLGWKHLGEADHRGARDPLFRVRLCGEPYFTCCVCVCVSLTFSFMLNVSLSERLCGAAAQVCLCEF